MKVWRFFDWVWHVKGSVPIPVGETGESVLDRLVPLFRATGTTHQRADGTLRFQKKDPDAQDKLSVFDDGMLFVEDHSVGSVLRYRLTSRALLFCFLAPLLFLAIAQVTILTGKFQKPSTEESDKSAKGAAKKARKNTVTPLNPIDKFLGAPAPEKPKKDKKEEDDKKPTPKAAYIFSGIFAALYLGGRILEDRLARNLFRKRVLAP